MSKSSEDELRTVLSNTAQEVSQMYENPRSWLPWMLFLLERLEEKANQKDPAYNESFKEMLSALEDGLRNRLRTGGW